MCDVQRFRKKKKRKRKIRSHVHCAGKNVKNKIFFPLYHYFHNISLEYSSIKNSSVFYVLFFFSFSSQRMFSSFSCNFFFLFSTFRLLYHFASPLISHLFSLFLSPTHNRTHIHSRPSSLSLFSLLIYIVTRLY